MYSLLKAFLFQMDAEKAHHFTMKSFGMLSGLPGMASLISAAGSPIACPKEGVEAFGLHFRNPVGLAAGFDKDGVYYPLMAQLGFGHVELGTVTPRPQAGNPKPRLFRLPQDRALINRMGFNNAGVEQLCRNLDRQGRPEGLVLGGNIGKNKDTPNEEAVNDYLLCLEALHDKVDYFTVNISSPNTPGLRNLQAREPLTRLLSALQERNQARLSPKPMLLKIAPDLSDAELDDILAICVDVGLQGIIATNTTISRDGLSSSAETLEAIGQGGLSGAPLQARAQEVLRYLKAQAPASLHLVGVGGIVDAASAKARLEAGADLVQVYSGMVYAGPDMVSRICKAIEAGH